MKHIVAIVFFCSIGLNIYSQCKQALSNVEFQQRYNQIASSRDDIKKLGTAKRVCINHCFYSAQVEQIAALFANDLNRLEFCTEAYLKTIDKQNFYEVYDAFAYFSNVFRLHDFVMSQRNPGSIAPPDMEINIEQMPVVVEEAPPPPPPLPEEEICQVSPQEFSQIKGQVMAQSFNNTKLTIAKQALRSKQCFTAVQIKELMGAFSFEDSKLELAKFAHPFCIDQQNYFMLNDAFTFSSSIDELNSFLENKQ